MNTTKFKQMRENDLDQINGGLLITGTIIGIFMTFRKS